MLPTHPDLHVEGSVSLPLGWCCRGSRVGLTGHRGTRLVARRQRAQDCLRQQVTRMRLDLSHPVLCGVAI